MAYLNADQRGGTAGNGKPSLTIDEAAVQLTRDQASWGDYWGDAVAVTFAFRSTAPSDMPDDTSGFSRFTTAQINATLLALQAWSDVANITFTRVGSGTSGASAYSNSATILFGNYSSGSEGAAAFAYYPYSYAYSAFDGDVWVNNSLNYNANPQMFGYGHLVLVHEIGHAIGISHPADYNAGPDENITYSEHATYFEDSMQYSVMSYFYESYTGASYGSPYPATIMLDDIAAAQRLYGANMTTRTGDTVYGFNSNAGRVWFEATSSSTPLIFAVWDAGGNDTLNFSGYSSNAKIELREGFFSDVGGLVGNVAIAKGAVIENAVGGAGADRITGNAVANRLQGNAGNDTLTGLGGADVFVFTTGGGGDVVTDFVIGTDKLDATAFGSYVSIVQSGADTVVNFSGTVSVRLTNVTASNLTQSSFIGLANQQPPAPPAPSGVTVNGSELANVLSGGSGDDFLYGFGGADQLDGKGGADTLTGGKDNDVYLVDNAGDAIVELAGEGLDLVVSTVAFTLSGQVENLTFTGAAAINGVGNGLANKMLGNGAANTLSGLGGDDWLDGRGGADILKGGAGNDIYVIHGPSEQIVELGGEGTDSVSASVNYTLPTNVEILRLTGTAANATGNTVNNQLYGTAGANTLDGRAGADYMSGGAGADSYIVDNSADQVIEGVGGGFDFVLATASFVLGAEIENLTLSGTSAINGTGNALANKIYGNGAANLLDGAGGSDWLDGRGGADTLDGGAANDLLIGGDGADVLTGGDGADSFVFTALSDSTAAAADRVVDFDALVDRIDLTAIDANAAMAGNQAFTWAGAFTGAAGQAVLAYDAGADVTVLRLDANGDGAADFTLRIDGHVLGGSGFLL